MNQMTDKHSLFIPILAATAATIWALSNYAMQTEWMFYWIIAAFGIPFTAKGMLSPLFVAAPLLMAIAMIFGTATAVTAASGYSLLAAITRLLARADNTRTIFLGAAYTICDTLCYGAVYHFLKSVSLFAAIVAMAGISYLVTSQFRFKNERWMDRLPLFLNALLASSCAGFLSVFNNPLIPIVALPIMAVIHYWTRLHEHRFQTDSVTRAPYDIAGN